MKLLRRRSWPVERFGYVELIEPDKEFPLDNLGRRGKIDNVADPEQREQLHKYADQGYGISWTQTRGESGALVHIERPRKAS